jgi:hypothetical protein
MMEVPTLIHVPRCGGTYLLGLIVEAMTAKYKRPKTSKHRALVNISVNERIIIRAFLVSDMPIQEIIGAAVLQSSNVFRVKLDEFLAEAQNNTFDIFALIIEPHGVLEIRNGLLDQMRTSANCQLKVAMLIRHPYLRARSMFRYIKSYKSKHEISHGSISSETFNGYVQSTQFEDSWIIRGLMGVPATRALTDADVEATFNFISDFDIADVLEADALFNSTMKNSCQDFELKSFDRSRIFMNESDCRVSRMGDEELIFNRVAEFDIKLYEKLLRRSKGR